MNTEATDWDTLWQHARWLAGFVIRRGTEHGEAQAAARLILNGPEEYAAAAPAPAVDSPGVDTNEHEREVACKALATGLELSGTHPQLNNLCWLAGRAEAALLGFSRLVSELRKHMPLPPPPKERP